MDIVGIESRSTRIEQLVIIGNLSVQPRCNTLVENMQVPSTFVVIFLRLRPRGCSVRRRWCDVVASLKVVNFFLLLSISFGISRSFFIYVFLFFRLHLVFLPFNRIR